MLKIVKDSGYTNIEVIPMITDEQTEKVFELLRQVMSLNLDELQVFHEEYKDYLVNLDWGRLGINWDLHNPNDISKMKDVVVLDESFKFLLNKEDDVYDEKYGHLLESKEGRNLHREG